MQLVPDDLVPYLLDAYNRTGVITTSRVGDLSKTMLPLESVSGPKFDLRKGDFVEMDSDGTCLSLSYPC